jgi:hypothetical protein
LKNFESSKITKSSIMLSLVGRLCRIQRIPGIGS